MMRCEVFGSVFPMASKRCRGLLSLCISDTAKQMLLGNAGFIPHLIDGALHTVALMLGLAYQALTIALSQVCSSIRSTRGKAPPRR